MLRVAGCVGRKVFVDIEEPFSSSKSCVFNLANGRAGLAAMLRHRSGGHPHSALNRARLFSCQCVSILIRAAPPLSLPYFTASPGRKNPYDFHIQPMTRKRFFKAVVMNGRRSIKNLYMCLSSIEGGIPSLHVLTLVLIVRIFLTGSVRVC